MLFCFVFILKPMILNTDGESPDMGTNVLTTALPSNFMHLSLASLEPTWGWLMRFA